MSWQVLLAIHLLFSTSFAIVSRRLAVNLKGFGRVVTSIIYLGVIAPGGLIVAFCLGDISFGFSALTWVLLGLVGLFFAGANFLAYRANEELDAAQFAIISNLQALFVIAIAGIFLGERLSVSQLLGAGLLIAASMDVAVEKIGVRTFRLRSATLIALGSCIFFAAALTTEKALLNQMNFATYVLVGWSMQSAVIGLLSLRHAKKIKHITRSQLLEIFALGLLRLGAGLSGIAAIRLVDISIVASVRSYKPILIFCGALLLLGEKRDIRRRAIGAALATVGLLLLI